MNSHCLCREELSNELVSYFCLLIYIEHLMKTTHMAIRIKSLFESQMFISMRFYHFVCLIWMSQYLLNQCEWIALNFQNVFTNLWLQMTYLISKWFDFELILRFFVEKKTWPKLAKVSWSQLYLDFKKQVNFSRV